jgi:hypothetical protein
LSEDDFTYEWNCIFPESAAQKADRYKAKSEEMATLTEAGILSRESALEILKEYGSVDSTATVGDNPNPPAPKPTTGTKK